MSGWLAGWPEHAARPKWPRPTLCLGSMDPAGTGPARSRRRSHVAEPSPSPPPPLIHYFQEVPPCTNDTKWAWPYMVRASRLAFHVPLRRDVVISRLLGATWRSRTSALCPEFFSYCHLFYSMRHRLRGCDPIRGQELGNVNFLLAKKYLCPCRHRTESMSASTEASISISYTSTI